ncbi:MAG: hypothetical protein OXH67_13095 [Acidimicrobiaceae bacterium]|nr:hypothetical protein [Acidimicrobiaceae bacterium]
MQIATEPAATSAMIDWWAIASVLVLIGALYVTWRSHKAEYRPYLTAQFLFMGEMTYLKIKNVGRVAATDIETTITPELSSRYVDTTERFGDFGRITFLAPSESRYRYVGTATELMQTEPPRPEIEFTYRRDPALSPRWRRPYRHGCTLELAEHAGSPALVSDQTEALVAEITKIRKEVKDFGADIKQIRQEVQRLVHRSE